jgi:putative FmdB family regulatory protein
MPLYEYLCLKCGQTSEILVMSQEDKPACQACKSKKLKKLLSATAAYSGKSSSSLPGPGDTSCCGHTPSEAGCAGPGSCCGKS